MRWVLALLFGSVIWGQCVFGSESSDQLYIELVKKVVANTIYQDPSVAGDCTVQSAYKVHERSIGYDWPAVAHTMIGIKRLDNIHACLEDILARDVPGDCIETGVWRGGATILMRAILKAHQDKTRKVWVADSFEGLPPPDSDTYPCDRGIDLSHIPLLAVSLPQVQENFRRYGLLDEQVVFVKGWFKDTLPSLPIDQIALLRLDGDLYESTMDALEALYPKLSIGGYVIIDDYGCFECCAHAVRDYRAAHGIEDPIVSVDWTGVYWKKTR